MPIYINCNSYSALKWLIIANSDSNSDSNLCYFFYELYYDIIYLWLLAPDGSMVNYQSRCLYWMNCLWRYWHLEHTDASTPLLMRALTHFRLCLCWTYKPADFKIRNMCIAQYSQISLKWFLFCSSKIQKMQIFDGCFGLPI